MRSLIRGIVLLFLFALGIEVAVRVDDCFQYGAPLLKNFNHESLFTYDNLGKRGKPHARYLKWELNSLGFRGPELRPGTLRVAVVGSSETFGLYESPEQEWPRQLEKTLNASARGREIQVANLAFPGMLLSTFAKRLDEFMDVVQPEVLVIYPSPSGYLYRDVADKSHFPVQQRFELRIGYRAQTIFKNNAPRWLQEWLRERQARKVFAANPIVAEKAPDRLLDLFRADLRQVLANLQKRKIVPVLVTHATYFGATFSPSEEAMMLAWRKFFPMLSAEGLLDLERRANKVLREEAIANNFLLVDAETEIAEGEQNFADFVHFTDHGAQLFAQLIAGRLQW